MFNGSGVAEAGPPRLCLDLQQKAWFVWRGSHGQGQIPQPMRLPAVFPQTHGLNVLHVMYQQTAPSPSDVVLLA